jgi:hypothetical protein
MTVPGVKIHLNFEENLIFIVKVLIRLNYDSY